MATHSSYGGSSIYILDKCPGALRLYPAAPAEVESDAAATGTCAHHGGELAIRMGLSAYDLVGMTFQDREFTQAMADDVQIYLSEIRRIKAENPDAVVLVEPKVTMHSVSDEVYGYVDCMIFVPSKRWLFIVDLKYGYVLVESSTMQIKHYAVSTLDTYQLWSKVDVVQGIIVQPRGEHIEGEVRRINYTIADCLQHQRRFSEIYAETKKPDAPIVAGEHCHYCKVSPICRKRLLRTLDNLYPDAPLELLEKGEIMELYKELATMKRQADKIDELANQYSKAGVKLDGYKLVTKRAFHECTDEEALVSEILNHPASNIKDRTALYNMRLKGKSALKDMPGVPGSVVNKYFKAPDNVGTELVKVSDRRPAIGVGSGIGKFNSVE